MRRQLAAGLALVLAGAAACGSTTAGVAGPAASRSDGVQAPDTAGFLHADSSAVVYLQWPVNASATASGTVKNDYIDGTAPNQSIEDSTGSFAVQFSPNGGVTFDFAASWGTVYGSNSGNTLTLNLPQKGGGLQAISFYSATPSDYNSALEALRGSLARTNRQAQHDQQVTQDEGTLADHFLLFDKIEKSLDTDLVNLGHYVSDTDTQTATTSQAAGKVVSETTNGVDHDTVCGDADSTVGDADTVAGYADTVSGGLDTLKVDLSQLRSTIASVNGDLSKALSDDPHYTGTANTPGPADVQTATNNATTAITHAVTTANAQIDHTNNDVSTAFSAATAAAKAGKCGSVVTTPPPIPHVS